MKKTCFCFESSGNIKSFLICFLNELFFDLDWLRVTWIAAVVIKCCRRFFLKHDTQCISLFFCHKFSQHAVVLTMTLRLLVQDRVTKELSKTSVGTC